MTDYDGGKYPKHYNSHELKDDGIVAANMDEILQIADKMNAPMFVQPPEMKRWMPYTIYHIGEVILDFFNRMQRCSQYGRMQRCSQYGVSGQYEPMWHNNYGLLTHDSGIIWLDMGTPFTSQQPILNIPLNLSFKKEEESQPMTDFIEEREV